MATENPQTVTDDNGVEYEEYSEEEEEIVDVPESSTDTPPKASSSAVQKTGAQLAGAVKTPIAPATAAPPGSKNPFETSYAWNAETSKHLEVAFPPMNSSSETTNDLTREKFPENRYWRSTAELKSVGFKSSTIRLENVLLGWSDSRNYGDSYVYAALPSWFKEKVLIAAKGQRPVSPDDPSLQSNVEQWWRTVNFKDGATGRMVKRGSSTAWAPTPLSTIFSSTNKAITATLVIKVHLKVVNGDKKALTSKDVGKIAIDAERIYLTNIMVDSPPAPRIRKQQAKAADPPAFKKDVESEELAGQLQKLGL